MDAPPGNQQARAERKDLLVCYQTVFPCPYDGLGPRVPFHLDIAAADVITHRLFGQEAALVEAQLVTVTFVTAT